jgi:glycosyltransferase involved in cell wall biosynthesis
MLQPVLMLDTLQARFRTYFDPPLRLEEIPVSGVQHCGRRRPGFPLILIVSPYCVYPPAHGGARRIHELIERCAREFDIILLSDEAENYTEASFKYFKSCHIVSLVGGREAPKTDHRIERIQAHSHAALAVQLRRLVEVHAPDIVQIEYVELAKLIEHRDQRPWILTLHDVLLESADKGTRDEDEFELQYINRFDAVMVCGSEDRALLKRDNVHIIRNGAHITKQYVPSREVSPILFIGPFRYPPNLVGIIEFLERVFPEVRSKVPNAKLWILGGPDAPKTAAREPSFAQPGVTVFDFIEDVTPYLKDCSITINPDKGVRGSSLKVIESLAAGRVCVSTRDGARGLLKSALPSLVVVDDEEFADRVVQLITDSDFRHRLEIPSEELHRYSWQRASEDQARIYRSLLETGYSSRTFAFGPANTLER